MMPERCIGEEVVNPVDPGLESRPIVFISIERLYPQPG
jgi:hypothetical protein